MPSYPYISGQSALVQTFAQLRKSVPTKVDSGYLQRFNIAPANESYIIATLRFLGIIDEDGNRVDTKSEFLYGNEDSFQTGFGNILRVAYSELFDEMGDALEAERDDLIHWFRASDKTSAVVGQRQATTFQTLAALAGHGELPAARSATNNKSGTTPGRSRKKLTTKVDKSKQGDGAQLLPSDSKNGTSPVAGPTSGQDVGLTVRIEVNLPAGGDAETYDAIFASIRKHLMS
ncbi:DUF5343 domain-containing protein [Nocardia mangyaensis]|uniref:DUF5343 domain-containing protein n=1 Tax=Nocardia mangyaensis TaxID=2213200 RepID=UPI0009034B33|nr:DUF5343 domain-containing protein [Nocardia mangyaensis]